MRQTKSYSARCFYNCLKRYIIDDILKTHSILKVSLGMKILAILLIPLFWGIVSATPSFKGINLIKDELENLDNQQNQNKNLDFGTTISDKQKFEQDVTRNELWKRSLFPLSQKDHVSSPDKEKIEDTVNPKNIILNGIELGRKLIDQIVQSILKIIHEFNSDISKNKLHNIQKRENTKPQNLIVKYKKDERLKNTFNLKNARKRKIVDQEALHSIIPQITINNNQRSSISRYNERLKKTDNNGYKTKRKQLYPETHNVQRNKRGIHTPLCNTLNKDNKNCPHNTDVVVKKDQTSIVESLNSGPALTNIIPKINTEAAKFNEFQMSASDSEFSKWLDNTPEYYFDYSEPLDISPKYTPIATNIKAKSAKTALDKTPDKSAHIKTYFQPDYEDSHSKWTNDKEFEYYTDLKKSPITWHGYSTTDETIPLPSEWDIIDKTTNDNKNVKSNTNSISKATVSEITNFEPNNKDIDIPSDWIANYKAMKDKSNDILFFKIGSHTGDNGRTGVIRKDTNKSLKTVVDAKSKNGKDDDVSKSVESTSIATTSETAAVSANHQKPSTSTVNDTIVNNKNNTAVAAESATLTKYSAGDIVINEYKEKQANWNIITAIVTDKNASISDNKATASPSVNSTLSTSSKNENESSQHSVKNNSISDIKINTKVIGDNETKDQRSNKNEELTKTVIQNRVSNDKNNSTEVKEVILSKAVSSGTGLAYSTENSDPYKTEIPSEWIVKYKSLGDRDYYSKLVISANSNTNNSTTTGDPYKPTNWTNEPKVTREPDDKWPSLEANAKTSAVQATAVSTEKIENLLNKKNEKTIVLSLKDLTEKDKKTTSVSANSNLNESTIKKQTSSNSSEDKKLLSTEDNKVVESTRVDGKTGLISDNNKQKLKSNNNEKVLNVNSQLVASAAGNTKAATTSENEKVQWKWNDESKNWIVKNDTISNNKVTATVEATAYSTAVTNNNNQTLTLKNNVTLNNQAVAGNDDAAIIIADDKNILKSNVKYNNPSIKDDSALDNKATSFSTANVDIAVATNNTNHQWRWNNEEATQSIKDNANLNNKVVALSAGNSKVATSVTDNRKVSAIIQSLEKKWKLAENNSELNIRNYDISNIEKTATVKNAYNAEQATIDKKLSWVSSEEEKYNVMLDNKEATTVKAYLTTTTTENDNQKWKWDNELKDSSLKEKVLLKNQTKTSALGDSVTATDSKSEIKHEIKSKILNNQKIVTLNNSEIASVKTGITSLPDIKYDKQEWDWANKDNDQGVRNNDKSNSEIDSLDKVNSNAPKASASNKVTWKWTSEGKVSSNKSNYLTANKTDLSSEASVKATETTENWKLFNFYDKDENSSLKKEIISNSKAAAFAGASTNSQLATDKNKNKWEKTQSMRDYIIYNNKTTELDEVNVKDTANIANDNRQSKLDEKESDLSRKNDVKSNKAIESVQANIELTASLEKIKKKFGSDNNNKTERINDDVIINDAAAESAANNSSISIIVSNKTISWAENENDNSSVKINDTFNNKEVKFTKDNTDAAAGLENNKKQGESNNNNIAQDVNDDFSINNQTTANTASNANATATITSKNQKFKSDDKSNDSIIKNYVSSNNKEVVSTEANTNVTATLENSKRKQQISNNNNETFSVKDSLIINNQATATAASNANATATIIKDKQQSILDVKNNNLDMKNNTVSNKKGIWYAENNTDVTATSENNKKQWELDKDNKTQSMKDDLNINDQVTASAKSSGNVTSTILLEKQQSMSSISSIQQNVTLNNKAFASTDAITDDTTAFEKVTKQWALVDNENQDVKKGTNVYNITAFIASNANAESTIASNKQQSNLDDKENFSSIKKNVKLNNKAAASSEDNTDVTAAVENDKKQSKSDNNKTQSVKDSFTINDQATATVTSNVNATATIIRDKQQSKLDEKNNNLDTKNNTALKKKGIWYAEDNTDVTATLENNKKQWKSDNNTTQSVKDDHIINNSNASFVESNANAASAIVLYNQQLRLNNKSNDSSVNKNKSLNKIEIDSAEASTDPKVSTEIDKQQPKLNNESNDSNIPNDFTLSNKETKSDEANSNAKLTTENDKEQLELNNKEKVLDNINKNSRLKVNITSNSEEATSAIRTDAKAESKVILTKNNDSRKIFYEKALEVSTLEPISEKSSSTIDTADINLENMGKDSLSDFNINDKEARARIDVISDLMTNTSATMTVKHSSLRENKKKPTDEIAGKSESSIFEVQTDYINKTKGELQSLEVKNNNSIQYNHSIAIAGASASGYTEEISNSLKESNSKLSDNNKKDGIDEIANTKAIAYNINEGDADTLVRNNTKVPELKIKGENVQSHQNLVSATAEAKARSVIGAENKQLNKQVKNYTFNNDHSIANVKGNTSTTVEVKIHPLYPDTEINKNSLKNTKASVLAYVKSEIDSVERSDDKKFDKNICNKNLTNNTNLRAGIETKAESNSVSMSNGINKRIEGRYNEEKNSVAKGTIDGESDNLVITSSKEKEIINDLNKTSNDLINWLLRWKSISNSVESNKNELQNDTKIDNIKSKSSYDEKHTIDQFTTTATLIEDKTKDTEKKIEKIDDADLIILKKPYSQQDTIGVTYIKDSEPPMILFRVIPTSLFEQVRKLIKQWEIVRISYAEPQI